MCVSARMCATVGFREGLLCWVGVERRELRGCNLGKRVSEDGWSEDGGESTGKGRERIKADGERLQIGK